MRQRSFFWLLASGFWLPAVAGEARLLDFAMPDAKVLIGIDIARIAASPLGQTIASQIEAADPSMQKFWKESGFNPVRDLGEVLIASTGGSGDSSLFLARTSLDVGRLSGLAKAQGAGSSITYQGVPIFAGPKKDSSVGAVMDSVLVIGPLADVQGAIDRRGGGAGLDAKLADKANGLRGAYDVWVVSTVPVNSFADNVPNANARGAMQGDVLKSVEAFSGGLKLGTDIAISVEIVNHTAKDAAALADALRFLAAMFQLDGQKGGSFAVEAQENVVKLSLSVSQDQLKRLAQAGKRAMADPKPAK